MLIVTVSSVICTQVTEISKLSGDLWDSALSSWCCCMPRNCSFTEASRSFDLPSQHFLFNIELKRSGTKGLNLWNAMVFLEYVPHTYAINNQSFQIQGFIFMSLKIIFTFLNNSYAKEWEKQLLSVLHSSVSIKKLLFSGCAYTHQHKLSSETFLLQGKHWYSMW